MARSNLYEQSLDRLSEYSDESLFAEIRRVSKLLGHDTLTIEDIGRHGRCSYAVIKKRFGGLRAALRAAGLQAEEFRRNPSREELLRDLARVWDSTLTHEGRRPYRTDLKKYGTRFSSNTYERHFGSWIKACEALLSSEEISAQDYTHRQTGAADVQYSESNATKQKRPIPLRIRYAILMRDRFTCAICGRTPALHPGLEIHVDHIKPESQGGTLDPPNLRCLCQECNLGKGSLLENILHSNREG